MPDPIRSTRRSPDPNRLWVGAEASVRGAAELHTTDLIVDGTLTAARIVCARLDIGAHGIVSCAEITVTHSAYIAGTLEAHTLDVPRFVITETGAVVPPADAEAACAVSSVRSPRIECGARIHASFRITVPDVPQPKGGILVAFRSAPK